MYNVVEESYRLSRINCGVPLLGRNGQFSNPACHVGINPHMACVWVCRSGYRFNRDTLKYISQTAATGYLIVCPAHGEFIRQHRATPDCYGKCKYTPNRHTPTLLHWAYIPYPRTGTIVERTFSLKVLVSRRHLVNF